MHFKLTRNKSFSTLKIYVLWLLYYDACWGLGNLEVFHGLYREIRLHRSLILVKFLFSVCCIENIPKISDFLQKLNESIITILLLHLHPEINFELESDRWLNHVHLILDDVIIIIAIIFTTLLILIRHFKWRASRSRNTWLVNNSFINSFWKILELIYNCS